MLAPGSWIDQEKAKRLPWVMETMVVRCSCRKACDVGAGRFEPRAAAGAGGVGGGVRRWKCPSAVQLLLILVAGLCAALGTAHGQSTGTENLVGEVVYKSPCPHAPRNCTRDNTVLLGGLFPLRNANSSTEETCNGLVEEKGFQRMMAMVYEIEELNKRSDANGIKLAFEIRDTCNDQRYANEQVVKFLHRSSSACDFVQTSNPSGTGGGGGGTAQKHWTDSFPISGIVGPSSSNQAKPAAGLAELFRIPIISYASTAAELNSSRYSYFFRVLPSDAFQARVIRDIVTRLQARFINILFSEGEYGEEGSASVREEVERKGWCIASCIKLPNRKDSNFVAAAYKALSDSLIRVPFNNAIVTVGFASNDDMKKLLAEVKSRDLNFPPNYTWIASDSWAQDKDIAALGITSGMLGVVPKAKKAAGFDAFYFNVKPSPYSDNRFLEKFWEQQFQCNPNFNTSCVTGNTFAQPIDKVKFQVNSKVPFVMDAVLAFWHGIDRLKNVTCPKQPGVCEGMRQDKQSIRKSALNGEQLRDSIRNVSFVGNSLARISFDARGELGTASYNIFNLKSNGVSQQVGDWQEVSGNLSDLNLSSADIQWHSGDTGAANTPVSRCSAPCASGEEQSRYPDVEGLDSNCRKTVQGCCWNCSTCAADQYTSTTGQVQTCRVCPGNSRPNAGQDGCVQDKRVHANFSDAFVLVNCLVAIAGIIATVWIGVVLFKTPSFKIRDQSALQRPFLVVILSGEMLAFVSVFLRLAEPSAGLCWFFEFWVEAALILIITPIAVRSVRGSLHHLRIHWVEHHSSNSGSLENTEDDSCFQDSGFSEHKSSVNSSPGCATSVESRFSHFPQQSAGERERQDSVFFSEGKATVVLPPTTRRMNIERKRTISSFVSQASDNFLDIVIACVLFFIALSVLSITAAIGVARPTVKEYTGGGSNEVYAYCSPGIIIYAGTLWCLVLCVTTMVITAVSMCFKISPPTVLKYGAMSGVGILVFVSSAAAVGFNSETPHVQVGVVDLLTCSFAITYLVSVVLLDVRFSRKDKPAPDDQERNSTFQATRFGSTFNDTTLHSPQSRQSAIFHDGSPQKTIEQYRHGKSQGLDYSGNASRPPIFRTSETPETQFIFSPSDSPHLAHSGAASALASPVQEAAGSRKKAARRPVSTQPRLERVISFSKAEGGADTSPKGSKRPAALSSDILLSPIPQVEAPDIMDYSSSPYTPGRRNSSSTSPLAATPPAQVRPPPSPRQQPARVEKPVTSKPQCVETSI